LPRYLMLVGIAWAMGALPAQAQIGPFLSGAGPVNRSMGGAAVANPLDSLGAAFWNPATTSALQNSMDFGTELVVVQSQLTSTLPANAFGAGLPPIGLSGSTNGDNGVSVIPSIGLVYRPEESPWTFGMGLYAVAGFSVNYPASPLLPLALANPILTPQPANGGVGLGALYANLQVVQFAPTLSYQVTDRLSIGGGPTVNMALLQADPLFVVSPDANGMYPPGTHTHMTWGGGFNLGAYYKLGGGWQLGASLKSPQWFEPFHYNTTDNHGLPRQASFRADLPLITSVGVGYTGFERWLLAADFRYADFGNARGLGQVGYDASGAAIGLGFRSIFAMSLGVQYQLTDSMSLRLGYSFNQDPIPNSQSSFNVASPTIIEHTLYAGTSYQLSNSLKLSLGYAHSFQNSIDGPLVTPLGAIPGSSVKTSASGESFMVGASVRY
jgi:long-chain fatty acid transport protein